MRTTPHHRLERLALAFSALVVVAAATLFAAAGAGSTAPRSVASNAYALGAYGGANDAAGVTAFGNAVGVPMQYAMEFLDGTSWATISNPSYQLRHWYDSGYRMIWAVPMLPSSGASLAVGATGAYDKYFATLARGLVSAGQGNAVLRIGWEFNGIWFPWSAKGHAAQFTAYWRDIVTTMRAVPGAAFTFEWNPDRNNLGMGNLASYYPGNAYVDYVGLDLYDVEWKQYPGAKAEFSQMESGPSGLDWLASFSAAHHKPMVFPEWGLGWGTCRKGASVTASGAVCGGDNALFIKDSSAWFASHDVVEVTYWDYGTSTVSNGKNPMTLAALSTYWVHPTRQVAGHRGRTSR